MTKKKKNGQNLEKCNIVKEDCVVFHNTIVFSFKKGDEVKEKELIKIMSQQDLLKSADKELKQEVE